MKIYLLLAISLLSLKNVQAQNITDDFEGNGTISTWFGDDCEINTSFENPYPSGINTSSKVLRYSDLGSLFANVRFDAATNFNLNNNSVFSLKIYVPSTGITGNQTNQVSLKLQNKSLGAPWSTQCEIIKPIVLNQWQTVTFNFDTDTYINLDPNSIDPIYRTDFNRVVIQINGENNASKVLAYIDDFFRAETTTKPVYNNLVWSDEFDGSGAVNSTNWFHQTKLPSGGSWHNGEIQHYTNRQVNSYISNGILNIIAKKETFTDQGKTKQYTSARLNSKFAFKYGRVEVRAKLPTGVVTWPAIWMLGQNILESGGYWSSTHGTASWPACGEIDIMEHWGSNQNYVQSAMHTPSSFGGTVKRGGQNISTASSQFHIYGLEWSAEKMIFSVDNVVHYVYNPAVKNASTWPFNAPQYLLLNIAIEPSISSNFTQGAMEIDYVRVYQENALSVHNSTKNETIFLFPNPASNQLNIKVSDDFIGSQAKIYSILGQELATHILDSQQNTFDISTYQNGFYLVKIKTLKGIKTYKFLKN
jgi:beta-glucanase (GH16 family)